MQYPLDGVLWSRAIVRELIQRELGVRLSLASVGVLLSRLGLTVQKRAYQRDPEAIERWRRESYPAIAQEARQTQDDIYFWDESGFRADAAHGKTWGVKGETPVVQVPGQRQSINAASAVSAKGAFWFSTYTSGLDGERFVELLKKLMCRRKKPLHLVLDHLPVHKTAAVGDYVSGTNGKLTLHFLPSDAPEPNPDERVWSHVKRTGVARRPLQKGEKLEPRIHEQLAQIRRDPRLVRSFLQHPSAIYISDL
jgi:transposase